MESKITNFLTFVLMGLACAAGICAPDAWASERTIRVAIFNDVESFEITVRGKFQISSLRTDQMLWEAKGISKAKVTAIEGGVRIGEHFFPDERLSIIPKREAAIFIQNRRFRGKIDIIKKTNQRMDVINAVDLEEYVQGVLYHEVSNRWPLEALKAQAVATRTYALFRISTNAGKDYDVTSDIYSQVYGGRTSERYRTNVAAKRTKGLVMTYQGKILPAYFHAACGGFTEDVSELWEQDLFPLKGVPCHYCKSSPHYSWKRNFRLKDIQDKLSAHGYDLGLIKEISAIERNITGRIRKLKITARDGKEDFITGKEFRNIIGPNIVKSTNFTIEMKGYYLDLIGYGWGHGVGMCQWGAYEMARKRKTFEEILDYYYPGLDIVDESRVMK